MTAEQSKAHLHPEINYPSDHLPVLSQIDVMDLGEHATLQDLPVFSFQVEEYTLVQSVEQVLRTHNTLPGIIITQAQKAIGVISRRKFFEQLGQRYGVSVYLRRPIQLMLTAIQSKPLRLNANTTIPVAVQLALSRSPQFAYEPIIVDFGTQNYGLLDIYTLLIAQSKLFSALQGQLQESNRVLEDRVKERTNELVKINDTLLAEVDKRREAEAALIEARDEALDASHFKSELLAKVSHELRTPLGAILGFAEMIQVGIYGEVNQQQAQAAKRIMNSANYLTNLVNQLLDQAQLDAGTLKPNLSYFSPSDLLHETVSRLSLMLESKHLDVQVVIAEGTPSKLYSDPVWVQQILINLLGNAIKFTQVGQITLRLYQPKQTHWAIAVSDTGVGISPEHQAQIFEPFRQVDGSITRYQRGVGLGLSIVRQFSALLGGEISLESLPGEGSTFQVTLPILDENSLTEADINTDDKGQ